MNKIFALTSRNIKEIVRDPLAMVFCVGFPVVMLVLMQLIFLQLPNIPSIFQISSYICGICVFGYTFSMLFIAMQISGDKNTEFINRIKLAPITQTTYYFSYVLAMLPIMLCQTILFFAIGLCFGLPFGIEILLAILCLFPSAMLFIAFGIFLGTICKNEKQAGPISSIIISLTGILGGIFMPVQEMGAFSTISNCLPFIHCTEIASQALTLNFAQTLPHLLWIVCYTIIIYCLTLLIKKIRKQ